MWNKTEKELYRKFEFKNFDEAIGFIDKVAEIARKLNHHPKITNMYNVVELWLSTHSAGDIVTDKDKELAKAVDEVYENTKI